LLADGHEVSAPSHEELDLFSPPDVLDAMRGVQAVFHLATRIPPPQRLAEPGAWDENDRLRSIATRVLVDAALQTSVETFILPSVTFVYPPEGAADEDTPVGSGQGRLQSMLDAEGE